MPNITMPTMPKIGILTPHCAVNPKGPSAEFHDWDKLMNDLLKDQKTGHIFKGKITIHWGWLLWWTVCCCFFTLHAILAYNHYRVYDKTYKFGEYKVFIRYMLAIKGVYIISYIVYLIISKNTGGRLGQTILGFLCYFIAGFLDITGGPCCKILCDFSSIGGLRFGGPACYLVWIPFLNWLSFIYSVASFALVQLILTLFHVGVLYKVSPDGIELTSLLPS